jgi:hypothetical protein
VIDSGILIRHGDGDAWHDPASGGFPTEAALEMLLAQSSSLLPWGLGQGLALASQVQVPPAGTADLVGVGLSGEIVLVECKLRSNAELRRSVVVQIFAYASALWRMSYDAFSIAWSNARRKEPLLQAMQNLAGSADVEWSEEDFRDAVSANLAAGRFRLLVAVDEITDELRSIVEYVNQHTIPDLQLLALQLQYRKDGNVEILLPTVYGGEAVQSKQVEAAVPVTEEELFAALGERCSPAGLDAARKLYDWWAERGLGFAWGNSQEYPSVTGVYFHDGESVSAWSCWAGPKSASISLNFEYLRKLPREQLERFLDDVWRIPESRPKLRNVREAEFSKRPGISIDEVFAKPGAMDAFIEALARLVDGDRPAASVEGSNAP